MTDVCGSFRSLVVFTCGLWCFAMIWTDRHSMPRAFQVKAMLLVLTIISGIAMTILGFRASGNYFGKYFAA
jgi:hypothetical protein